MNVLRELREQKGYTQEFAAQQLGISRQTYIKYEKDSSIQDLALIRKIADFFDVDYTCIIENKMPGNITYNQVGTMPQKSSDMRIDIPIENIEKFKQVFLYILSKVGAKPNVGQTVLYKLLYFIDFDYYELFETQLMGLKYIKNTYGPTPLDFAKITNQMEKAGEIEKIITKFFNNQMTKYLPLKEPDLAMLSAQEIKHIDNVLNKYSDMNAKELSDYSHKDIPWLGAKPREIIDYEAVFYRNSDTSVREYNE